MIDRWAKAMRALPAEAAVITLAALAIRAEGLARQSLWYDEGTSAQLARHAPAEIVAAAAGDIHPPLFYLLLAGWTRLLGDSEWALRALSVFAGTIVVAGVWRLARRSFGRRAALAAGLVAVGSPYLVWYSQEARMYSLAAMWAVLIALVGASGRGATSERRLAAMALITTAALYTHYLGGLCALGLAGVIAVVSGWRSRVEPPPSNRLAYTERRRGRAAERAWHGMRSGLVVVLFPLLAFLPWLAQAWPAIRDWPATSSPFGPGFLLRESAGALSLGEHSSRLALTVGPLLPWIAVFGLVATGWRGWMLPQRSGPGRLGRPRGSLVTVLAWWGLPLVVLGLISIRKPAWQAKQIIVAAPAFEIALGLGCWQLARLGTRLGTRMRSARLATMLTGLFAAAILAPRLDAIYLTLTNPAQQRDDYRGIVRQIQSAAKPADAVVLDAPTQVEVFDYYNRGRLATFPLPVGRPVDRAATDRQLDRLAARGGDVWAVLWATEQADPERVVESWLSDRYFKVSERWQGRLRFARWAGPPGTLLESARSSRLAGREEAASSTSGQGLAPSLAVPVRFGDRLELRQLDHDPLRLPPGSLIRLAATWRVAAVDGVHDDAAPPDYSVFCHLLDGAGRIVAQRDLPPLGGLRPTSAWRAGEDYVDRIGFEVPGDLLPGRYVLELGLYEPAKPDLPRATVHGAGADPTASALVVGELELR